MSLPKVYVCFTARRGGDDGVLHIDSNRQLHRREEFGVRGNDYKPDSRDSAMLQGILAALLKIAGVERIWVESYRLIIYGSAAVSVRQVRSPVLAAISSAGREPVELDERGDPVQPKHAGLQHLVHAVRHMLGG